MGEEEGKERSRQSQGKEKKKKQKNWGHEGAPRGRKKSEQVRGRSSSEILIKTKNGGKEGSA